MYLNIAEKLCLKLKLLSSSLVLCILLSSCKQVSSIEEYTNSWEPAKTYTYTFVETDSYIRLEDLYQDSPVSWYGDYQDFRKLVTGYINDGYTITQELLENKYNEIYLESTENELRIIFKGNKIYVLTRKL